jgi:metallo-beta-lactamase class B
VPVRAGVGRSGWIGANHAYLPNHRPGLWLRSRALKLPASTLAFWLGLIAPATAIAQADSTSRSWNQPVEPFRIIDNIYYVGASGVTSFLITTPAGHIVTDGGLAETAPLILANIKKLGYKPEDVRILLNSHAHYDHAGGLAALKQATGARLYASEGDAALLRAGGRGDFRFRDTLLFPPVQPDHLVKDGEVIRLGGFALTIQLTPGHTRGCTSWTANVKSQQKNAAVLFICSTSILDYRFVRNPSYPGIADDYERTFLRLHSLPCDVMLSAHADFFELQPKRTRLTSQGQNPFIDPALCQRFIKSQENAFRRAVARQRQ